jgi:peptidoglycan/LPS O-acetylase OafA/YrhL
LSITIAHAHGNAPIVWSELQDSWLNVVFYPFSLGIARVYLFFVISGFSIHLFYAKSKMLTNEEPKIKFGEFWKRRLWRLYPPYFVALIFYIVAALVLGKSGFGTFFTWDVVSHLLMIHNLDSNTVYSLNGAFWTIGVEEQIYLAYFFLLYLRNKFGWKKTLMIAFSLRAFAFLLSPIIVVFTGFKIPVIESSLATWCLWIFGAIAVENAVGLIRLPKWMSSIWLAIGVIIVSSAWYLYGFSEGIPQIVKQIWWFTAQPLWGIGFFFLVNYAVTLETKKIPVWSSGFVFFLARIGIFSYSLYLINELVIMCLPNTRIYLRIFASIFAGYLFHLVFERPFMSKLKPYKTE